MRKAVKSAAEFAGRLLYPPRCAVCDALLDRNERMICGECGKTLLFLREPACLRCGRPVEDETEEYCPHCRKTQHLFEKGFAPFIYDGRIRDAVLRFKFGHRAEYAAFFGAAVWTYGKKRIREWDPDLIVPVPVYRERQLRRGYNQAELLAEELSARSGIPCSTHLATRVRHTLPQKELDEKQRRKNLLGAFRIAQDVSVPETILIVDDIYTTGATIDALAAHLLRKGAKKIYFACASAAPGSG